MIQRRKQRGTTLLVALVMLVVLTLLVISAIRSSSTNLRIAGNMQMQEEAAAAAQQGIEQVISSNFTAAPASTVINVDINQDGNNDYAAAVDTPTCLGSKPVQNNDPSIVPECISSGAVQNTGIFFATGVHATGTSWCYAQQWEVRSTVQDSRTGASTSVHQGVSLNVPAGTGC